MIELDWPILTLHVSIDLSACLSWGSIIVYVGFLSLMVLEIRGFIGKANSFRYPWFVLGMALFWPLFLLNRLSGDRLWPMNKIIRVMNALNYGQKMSEAIESSRRRTGGTRRKEKAHD